MQSRLLLLPVRGGGAAAAALRRLSNIALKPLRGTRAPLRVRRLETAAGDIISIGDVHFKLKQPKNPELVPLKHMLEPLPQALAQHFQWIMQKDLLGQDVFLIGPPGPLRRSIAMQYLELTKREVEYMALSRDTTETDLKQRREIRAGTAFYLDQCAVRAATEGRILVLEGLEKAERNVLPVLNNLLENREMQLEDGRFLMSADRYDKLLKDHTKEELNAWKIVRVSEDFRVIALGLPVPRYPGNPLDPPLRSRFQARDIYSLPFKDQLAVLYAVGPNVRSERVSQMLSFATTLCSQESTTLGLFEFPVDNLAAVIKIMDVFPMLSAQQLLHRLYPYDLILGKEGQTGVKDVLKTFELLDSSSSSTTRAVLGIKEVNGQASQAIATVQVGDKDVAVQIPVGTKRLKFHTGSPNFIRTSSHDRLLAEMIQSHMVKDICLIGGKGCGKTVIAKEFADLLAYRIEPITLYQDMTARDLLQQRYTLPNGDTAWRHAPLVTAALEGKLVVLDGIHRVNPGTLAVLQRLIHDRELTLYDGSRLLRTDRYEELKKVLGLSDEDLQRRLIYPIHPSFRILALAEPPVVGSGAQQWLGSELLTMFLFHSVRPLSMKEEAEVLTKMIPHVPGEAVAQLLQFTHKLRQASDPTVQSLASSLSTRQLLRICNRFSHYPEESLYHAVNKACLSRFLPNLARSALQKNLKDSEIEGSSDDLEQQEKADIRYEIKSGILTIGKVSVPLYNPDEKMKVPDVLFYENTQHMEVMEDMLKDFLLGEHLLLVGNQGVGKNKIVDHFLHLLNRPREYLQLHRDTTVQSLTLQPSVQQGIITYEDSPLVKAVKLGHILVIDEADKAPTNVTCILKTLVESGEMILSDGRRIVVGDIFSCNAVDNPKPRSELAMLRQYGPDVPESVLQKLVSAFGELRNMADQGIITYPYSTREVVNIVKHLQKFPKEGLANVVRNVFDFDSYNGEMREILISTLHKHGIPIGAKPTNVQLAKELPLPDCKLASHWTFNQLESTRWKLTIKTQQTAVKGPVYLKVQGHPLERHESRGFSFTEQQAHWRIPLNEVNIVCDVVTVKGEAKDSIYVATCNPVSLYSMTMPGNTIYCMDLYDIFPRNSGGVWQPFVTVAPLDQPLHDQVVLHEEQSNVILLLNLTNGAVSRIISGEERQSPKKAYWWANRDGRDGYKMCREFSHKNWLVFYKKQGNSLDVLDVLEGRAHTISLPIEVKYVHLVAEDRWLLVENKTNKKFLLTKPMSIESDLSGTCQLHVINEESVSTGFGNTVALELSSPNIVSKEELPSENLSVALGQKIVSPNRILSDENSYATIVVGFPDLMSPSEVYTWKRKASLDNDGAGSPKNRFFRGSYESGSVKQSNCITLTGANQVIRAVAVEDVPINEIYPKDVKPPNTAGFLEVTDLNSKKIKYIPIPSALIISPYTQWLSKISNTDVLIAPIGAGGVVTVDMGGHVRLWETGFDHLQRSLLEWRTMIGQEDGRPLQITIERDSGLDVTAPKHGRIDVDNAPHVGGNTWAGGTGGRDTAGLGGKGGPYRLDAGHKVYQVSQAEKDAVPEEVKRAARAMAEKAFKERLKEIHMSEYDAATYERFSGAIRRQVQSIRVVLDSLQAKGKERQWLRHQSIGELDDTKIIDGLTGEKAIYKRRGELEPELGSPQLKPKRLRLLVDVSGSMYRFNGLDGRLERSMEAVCMVLEAFENYEHKFKYDIVGHSGDGFNIELVRSEKPPRNNKERLQVMKTMHAHSQFCMSGDHTLEGTEHAIQEIAREEADERFVIVLSDANLERYGISPARFTQVLTCNPQVNAFAIFIGSLGDQAERLQQTLPAGRSFVAMDTKQIPQILQQIFTSTMLSTA
ncbi:von Willebrand factor A domain-containing protein 8 isoform X2 [Rhincodon typus]|uniref:von Willebrand factor A domain-containing protein 8 isoform X2 n=1 Tax=Rhincodon typus TaxID=259920 RepID=UPI0020305DEB|nr:von Willebrand factor A domain-containing protein 8 isoform X2 [Rhincodon typus]